MKRCWFGAGLLIVLLAVSLGVTWGMDKIHEPIAADLKQAAECAELGDWHNAETTLPSRTTQITLMHTRPASARDGLILSMAALTTFHSP